jgi:hypothetical protein
MKMKNDISFYFLKKNNDYFLEDSVETSAYIINFNLYPIKSVRFLLSIITFLGIASLIGNLSRLYLPDFPLRDSFINLFDVGRELSIPSLYSTSVLLFCSALLMIISSVKRMQRDRYQLQWAGLSCLFLYLGMDELTSIHESMGTIVPSIIKARGLLYYSWVIPGMIFALVCLLVFWKFLTHLPKKTRNLFLAAGCIYIFGAVGLEMIGGYIDDIYGNRSIQLILEVALEEFSEMTGIAVFFYALNSYISQQIEGVTCKVNIADNHSGMSD